MYIKSKWLQKDIHANTHQKKTGVVILILDRAEFNVRKMIRNKEGYYIMIKGSILQEDKTILNMYAQHQNP